MSHHEKSGGFASPLSNFPTPSYPAPSQPPPSYTPSQTPAAGHRIPLNATSAWPGSDIGPPAARDADGSEVFVGSVILRDQVIPCKVLPTLPGNARWCYGGLEQHAMDARYDVLPIDNREMEWVEAKDGVMPKGRRPVEGGYERDGKPLFHALVPITHNGTVLQVPGKTGEHLRGANAAFGGREVSQARYRILLWR